MSAPIVEFPSDLDEWDGWCLELVDDLLHKYPDGDILYIELGDTHPLWTYHAAMVLDGLVYDAWHPNVRLPPAEYVERVFGAGVSWEINPGSEDDDVEEVCDVVA